MNGTETTPVVLVRSVIVGVLFENTPLAPLLGAVKVTVTPVTGFPAASVTVTLSGFVNAELTRADCGVVPVVAFMSAAGPVTTVATCTGVPLDWLLVVTEAVSAPKVKPVTLVRVSCVAVAAVTIPVPLDNVTVLFVGVVENPNPLIVSVVDGAITFAVLGVTVSCCSSILRMRWLLVSAT